MRRTDGEPTELKDTHKYSHVHSISVTAENCCRVTFVEYVPSEDWNVEIPKPRNAASTAEAKTFQKFQLRQFVQTIVAHAGQAGAQVRLDFGKGVEAFPAVNDEIMKRADALETREHEERWYAQPLSALTGSRRESSFGSLST